jgi:hypothetical protein
MRMDFTLLLTLITFLLERERRLSYRYIRRQFTLDDKALEELCYELVVGRGLARDDNGEALVWFGSADAPASVNAPGEASAPKAPAHRLLRSHPEG